ncbi:MAG: ABC transporter ATP-binding protein, partial [Geminicoccaceae bacterium]
MDTGVALDRRVKLAVRNVSKTYGPVTALAGTSLDMAEGEFLTLLGPSGSGKTTLLMLIAGLVQPSGGEIWIDGKLATFAEPEKRDIGVVFQNYALFPHLTIAENIAFPLHMRRMKAETIKQEVARVLDIVQLPHVAGRLPRELSGGQQQRIALARCIVYHPSIILMDEPLGALDRKLRDRMQIEIKSLHRRLGITILYVTHDQDEAMAMSDRICLMNQGWIEQIGSPDELYFQPATRFAADFLGESNFIRSLSGPTGTVVVRPENVRLLAPGQFADYVLEGTMREVMLVGGVS